MIDALRTDQQQRWRSGERVRVEWYVEQHPELRDNPAALVELILAEIALRAAAGERPELPEYFRRFPSFETEWKRRLAGGSERDAGETEVDRFATVLPGAAKPMSALAAGGEGAAVETEVDRFATVLPGDVKPTPAPAAGSEGAAGETEVDRFATVLPGDVKPTPAPAAGTTAKVSGPAPPAEQTPREEMAAPLPPDTACHPPEAVPAGPTPQPAQQEGTRAQQVFETVAAGVVDREALDTFVERPDGPQIPGFEILKELGRGGMGIVYQARQLSADRLVALKVVRNDVLDTLPMETRTSTLERFQQEAQAAAKLEHDNLVTVFEVGTAGGLRYYAMRYVEGRSLIDMLRDAPLDNRRAAGYLEPVSRALQYAHERGILHRDLKPHNILVDKNTDRPLVADFGLAKFMERRDELTMAGEVMGTPSYMPPEQARDAAGVTATADVYSLGATLYHLLTLRPPFQAANVAETIRQIIDEEPVPPRQLNPAIDRDLETICLKCLQKEPARRYESAQLLADDLRRYLNGEPILARPISAVGRMWRWCRRKPVLASLTLAASVLLMISLAAIGIGTWNTVTALQESDQTLLQAMDAVDALFTDVSENDLFDEPGMKPFRKDLLERARDQYKALSDLRRKDYFLVWRRTDPGLGDAEVSTRFHTARITQEMGDLGTALQEFEDVRTRQQNLLDAAPNDRRRRALGNTLNALGSVQVERSAFPEAVGAFQQATTIRRQLADQQPDSLELQRLLANTLMNLGTAERDGGRIKEGFQQQAEAQQVRERLLARLATSSDNDEFRAKVLQDSAAGLYQLGLTEIQLGPDSYPSADQHFGEAIQAFEELVRLKPRSPERRYRLAICCRQRGLVKLELQDLEAAAALFRRATSEIEPLAVDNPEVPKYAEELIVALINQAELLYDDLPQSRAAWNAVLAKIQALRSSGANGSRFRREEAVVLLMLGNIDLRAGNDAMASERLSASLALLQQLQGEFPDDPIVAGALADTRADLEQLAGRIKPEK